MAQPARIRLAKMTSSEEFTYDGHSVAKWDFRWDVFAYTGGKVANMEGRCAMISRK
jgi:hypothetical protein